MPRTAIGKMIQKYSSGSVHLEIWENNIERVRDGEKMIAVNIALYKAYKSGGSAWGKTYNFREVDIPNVMKVLQDYGEYLKQKGGSTDGYERDEYGDIVTS